MSQRPRIGCKKFERWIISLTTGVAFFSVSASASLTPEQETRRLARALKPVSNELWAQIAGEKASEKYAIVKGDTLYDISHRLFGDAKYWPKIWALNNGRIINPHLIFPGNSVSFLGGSGNSLPSVGLQTGTDIAEADQSDDPNDSDRETRTDANSGEWKRLPHQGWEDVSMQHLPPQVDPDGFDSKKSRIHFTIPKGMVLNTILSEKPIEYLGTVTGSRKANLAIVLGDTVFVKSEGELQVGDTYTLTNEAIRLKGAKTLRKIYSYQNLGKLKIIGVRDHLYVGAITAAFSPASRGSYLIAEQKTALEPSLIPGPSPILGAVTFDPRSGMRFMHQFLQVLIDRGSDDGIKPGMVFRSYQHFDPGTDKLITNSDFIVNADYLVVQVTPTFCQTIVLNGSESVTNKTPVALLMDLSDLTKLSDQINDLDAPQTDQSIDHELDELDRLDPGGELGDQEKRELKQIEQWKDGEEKTPTPDVEDKALPQPPAPQTDPLDLPPAAPSETPIEPATEPAIEPPPASEVPQVPSEVPSTTPPVAPSETPVSPPVTPSAPTTPSTPDSVAPAPDMSTPSFPDEPPPPPEM